MNTTKIKVFRASIRLLKSNYAFPRDESSFNDPYIIWNFFKPVIMTGLVPILGTFGFLFMAIKDRITSEQVYAISILSQFFLMYLIIIFTYLSAQKWKTLMVDLSEYKYGKPPYCDEMCKILDRCAIYSFYFLRIKSIFHLIYSYWTNSFCEGSTIRGDHRYICGSTIPIWFPFEIKSRIIRAMMIIGGNSLDFLHYCIFVLFALILFGSILLIVLRVKHLKTMLCRVKSHRNEDKTEEELDFCIKYHSEIVGLVQKMNDAGRYPLIPNYVSIPILLAMFSYQSLKMNDMLALLKLILWIGGVSLLCLAGQQLEAESSSLTHIVSDLPYYKFNRKTKKNFLLFLARVGKPLNLEMKPFAKWNNDFLVTVIKGCYTYFMFLFQMSRKTNSGI
ncbi:hypothetical protein WA026_011464 [Henosepilachna vigintioctopunctata]|uniref:Odorant receptor n=1 Tax=Henosepilachna vigintioctopunctata TaxID=420089 RepID=A0AAW1TR84_9CUCU